MSTRRSLFAFTVFLSVLSLLVPPAQGQQNPEQFGPAVRPPTDENIMAALDLVAFERLGLDLAHVQPGQAFEVKVTMLGEEHTLVLTPKSLRGSDFKVWASGGDHNLQEAAISIPKTYRGYLRGLPTSRLAASLIRGQLYAVIMPDADTQDSWYVQPLSADFPQADDTAHIVYSTWDTVSDARWTDINLPNPEGLSLPPSGERTSSSPPPRSFYLTEIAIDADWELYTKNNSSVTDTVDDVESVFNAVTLIYERDTLITWEITEIVVRTEEGVPYPTTLTHPGYLLEGFRFWWNKHHQDIHRDVAHLMTGKNLLGNVIGVGWDRVICDSLIDGSGYSLARTRFHTNFNYRVTVTTHEIAHNYGISAHCDSEPECYIMCSYLGQCDGVGLPNFSPWSIDIITQFADYFAPICLDTVPDDAIALVAVDANTGSGELLIEVTPPDRNGKADGVVPFTRKYYESTAVALTAPLEYYYYWMLWRFEQWELDGTPQPAGQNELLLMTLGHETMSAEAQYRRALVMPITSEPIDGVSMTVDPPDLDGQATGDTPFDVVYFINDTITLEAPATVGQYKFKRWIIHGDQQPVGQTVVQATIPTAGTCSAVARYYLAPHPADPIPSGHQHRPGAPPSKAPPAPPP